MNTPLFKDRRASSLLNRDIQEFDPEDDVPL